MIRIPLSRARLGIESALGILFGGMLCFLANRLFMSSESMEVEGFFIFLAGLICLIATSSPVCTLLAGTPALIADEAGLKLASYFGKMKFLRWSEIGAISIERRLETQKRYASSPDAYVSYLIVWDKRTPRTQSTVSVNKLNERRSSIPLDQVVDKLKTHPVAQNLLDESALNYQYQSTFQRMRPEQKAYAAVAVFVILSYLFFAWRS